MASNIQTLRQLLHAANAHKTQFTDIPTMLSPQEQYFLYLLAREYYSGEGDIFDGGIFLGGCTNCFARGLSARSNPPQGTVLHTYDIAQVFEGHLSYYQRWGITRQPGDSTADIIKQNIASMPCNENIRFHHGDILNQAYPERIEIMFLDICKTQAVNHGIQKLFSRLLPGKSLIVQQDYIHPWNPYIHATMGYLAEYFEPVGPVWFNSMVFLLKKEIPLDILSIDPYDHAPIETLSAYIMEHAPRMSSTMQITELYLACAVMLYEKGRYDECLALLQRTQPKPCYSDEINNVTTILCQKMMQ